jgi:hypothetical protein
MAKTKSDHEEHVDIKLSRSPGAEFLEIYWGKYKTTIGHVYHDELIDFCIALVEDEETSRLEDDYHQAKTILQFRRQSSMRHLVEIDVFETDPDGRKLDVIENAFAKENHIKFEVSIKVKARDFAGALYFELEKLYFLNSEKRTDIDFPILKFRNLQKCFAKKYGSIGFQEAAEPLEDPNDSDWKWPSDDN